MSNFICGLCGTEHKNLQDYMACVAKCGEKAMAIQKKEEEHKRLEKVNAALNGVKQAKKYYEEKLEMFKAEYPEEYKLNFGSSANTSPKTKTKSETMEFSYENNGKDKPKMSAKVNGKEIDPKSLLDDDTMWLAHVLSLLD